LKALFLPICLCSLALADEASEAEQFSDTGRILPVFQDGKYSNPFPIDSSKVSQSRKINIFKLLFRTKSSNSKPDKLLPAQYADVKKAFPEKQNGLHITWLGHSSLLAQIDGVRILIDPVFTNEVSPVPLLRSVRRFQKEAPVSADELPFIDAVFISHDHYDHLSAETIIDLAPKVGYFLMPAGVGSRFKTWGIAPEKIREYTWWQEGTIQGKSSQTLRFVCTPARHRSGRSLFGGNTTLWASWVLIGSEHRLFYSGDTSYGLHFKQIGHHYGPFDVAIIENGQYNVMWPNSHLFPEEGVQANLDLHGKYMLPVHWGSFELSTHDWREPIERVTRAAKERGVLLLTPQIGETRSFW